MGRNIEGDERSVDYPGYEGCDLDLIQQLLQRRQEGIAYLKDLQQQIDTARAAGADDSVLCRARSSTEMKIAGINKKLRAERLRVDHARLADLTAQRDLVRDLNLFQCLRKASAILSHRRGEPEQVLRAAIEAYLLSTKKGAE